MAKDLSTSLAACATCDEQIDALENYVAGSFDLARGEQNIRAKIDRYWSVANDILAKTKESISPVSNALLSQDTVWAKLASASPRPWHGKLAAEMGARLHNDIASLDARSRMEHDVRLWSLAKALVAHTLWQLAKNDFPDIRRRYHVDIDAAYPLRDINGKAVFVSLDAEAGLDEPFIREVSPFIDQTVSRTTRAGLYHVNLDPARIDERDLLSPWERPLIGQMGVFARRSIPKETCVGIYGGILIKNRDRIIISNPSYMAKCPGSNKLYVNGENIVSLMNTTFSYDSVGTITGHDIQRVNLRAQPVPCIAADGTSVSLIAMFADREIDKNVELRWTYGYGAEELASLAKYLAFSQ